MSDGWLAGIEVRLQKGLEVAFLPQGLLVRSAVRATVLLRQVVSKDNEVSA